MNIVVIGAQWGDEGKGKIVDFLAEDAALIVRFSGGANAGHTIVLGSEQYALHLIPSGVLYPGKIVVLGAAMVIDPNALFDEIAMLEARGIAPAGRIFISDRAHIVLPSAIALDKARDAARKQPLGTTGRGIGTSYAMKSERVGVRLADLDRLEMLAELSDEDRAFLEQHRERLLAMSIDLAAFLAQAVSASPSGMKRATVTQGGVAGPPEAVSASPSPEKMFTNEGGGAFRGRRVSGENLEPQCEDTDERRLHNESGASCREALDIAGEGVAGPPQAVSAFASSEKAFANDRGRCGPPVAVPASPSGMQRATVTQGGVAGPPEAVSAFASSEKAFANDRGRCGGAPRRGGSAQRSARVGGGSPLLPVSASILFEGAQGALLDLDLGTYPYVSSGMSCAAGAAIGGCIGPRALDAILGVFKAYSTRVGNGPFPSEFRADDEGEGSLCHFVRETGREYGVTTGRARRCGYLDLVALRYACRTNSIDSLVMTHLDVYDTLARVTVCVAYMIDGALVEDFPASIAALERASPVLKSFAGWQQSLAHVRTFDALPAQAREYIGFIEGFCATPIGMVSVGYERSQTIVRNPVWG